MITYIGAPPIKHTGTTDSGEAVGGSSGTIQFSPGRGSTKMISDGCPYANRTVLV